jgi:hypothetical protein
MAAPTTIIVTFTGGTGSPATITITLGVDYTQFVHNAFLNGGIWFTNPLGALSFIPFSQITLITAQ